MSDPRAEYERRLAERRAIVAAEERRSARVSHLRVLVFVILVVTLGLGLGDARLSLLWSIPPLVAFLGLVVHHELIHRRRDRAGLAVAHYERALRRLDDRWRGDGVVHRDHVPADHPYAADLDLFGRGSLFDLLCTARTRGGEATLAGWLLEASLADEIRGRQAAVLALRERVDLREDLALLGGDVRVAVEPATLIAWATAPSPFPGRPTGLRALAVALALAAIAAAIVAFTTDLGAWPLVIVGVIEAMVMRSLRPRVASITAAIEEPRRELDVLAHLLARVEREDDGGAPPLRKVARQLAGDVAGSKAIARLAEIADWLEARKSGIFAPIAFLLMWEVHGALAIERWRREHGPRVAAWLAALAEFEALAALAAFAYERASAVTPTILEGPPRLRGDALRHPLLRGCVANSVDLGDPLRVLMVSGSNMSGKSTLLRTVGINIVLAQAGAPITGAALALTPLQLGATLRIEDSLEGAASRFYAELQRLRHLRDLARRGDPPLLFLLDEIFHGTNSHDRKIGAEAVIRTLVDDGAIGLCTTHDLALAEAITDLGARAANVHFQDEAVDGALVFDYQMRPGIVRRSNALALMRSIGLLDPTPLGEPTPPPEGP